MSQAVPARRPWPWRMIVRGAFQDGWSLASQDEKNRVFRAWIEVHRQWQAMGCRLIVTLDDELNMVGQPGARLWNFYSVWEIPDPGLVYDLLNLFRAEGAEFRLDRYFRLETVGWEADPRPGARPGRGATGDDTGVRVAMPADISSRLHSRGIRG